MRSVSKPFKLILLRPNIYSLHFEEKHNYALYKLAKIITQHIPECLDVTNTFNRINLFIAKEFSEDALLNRLNEIDLTSCYDVIPSHIWELPICFDASFSTDLSTVFSGDQAKIDTYRKAFLATPFTLEFYGFLPGFGYLSGLPQSLHLDRKKNPDRALRPGAVAVGGEQVGVYPQESPGGWQYIGNCPVPWINFDHDPPVFMQAGDGVRFVEIDLKQHKKIALAVEMNKYQPICMTL